MAIGKGYHLQIPQQPGVVTEHIRNYPNQVRKHYRRCKKRKIDPMTNEKLTVEGDGYEIKLPKGYNMDNGMMYYDYWDSEFDDEEDTKITEKPDESSVPVREIEKIECKPGDILLFKMPKDMSDSDLERYRKGLSQFFRARGVDVILTVEDIDVKKITPPPQKHPLYGE